MSEGFLQQASRARKQGKGWAHLPGDSLAFVLARSGGTGPVLVVCDEADAAARITRALKFFHETPHLVELYPEDDCKPYDGFSPSPELVARRLRVLHRIDRGDPLTVVASARALMQGVPTKAERDRATVELTSGDEVGRQDLMRKLSASGYLATQRVDRPGRFASRGEVFDAWSAGLPKALRIEFFDDEVEEVRTLDPATLHTKRKLKRALLLPAREAVIDTHSISRAQQHLGALVAEQNRGHRMRRTLIEDLRSGVRFAAIEDYLPALVDTETLLDLFTEAEQIVVHPSSVGASLRDFWSSAKRRWSDLEDDERPLVPFSERYRDPEAVLDALTGAHPVFEFAGVEGSVSLGAQSVEGFAVRGVELGPVVNALTALAADGVRVGLVARTAKRAEMMFELLGSHGLNLVGRASPADLVPGEVSVLVGDLPKGFIASGSGWAFIPGSALFGGTTRRRQQSQTHQFFDVAVGSLSELREGDPVVHQVHGIGRYLGLERMELRGVHEDFVKLEYAGGDFLFIPTTSLSELSKYTPATRDRNVKLDKLGGQTWERRKGKVRDKLLAKAQDLLSLQAKRELAERPPMEPPGEMYQAFVARFPYVETPDQAQAILDIQEDLSSDHPMDRLLCGDVGFGKTEVAMRATMRAVESGHQVAVLTPTTVLAFQHLMTFKKRFEGFPIRVEMLSRFLTAKQQKSVLSRLSKGEIDIIIGTHRLLSRSVRFKDLSLVVVDEEHRFGVTQKNKLKKMRAGVDLLSMSATPIPRTLQMAISGVRQMSVMATPPRDRLSVRTTTARFKEARVRDAIRVELARGGQCYFIHNRIETIEKIRERLEQWVPEASFRIAHGQMGAEALERILMDFMERKFDVLICTAIVESGVDLPNVNTMLVHQAERFGLSQLYQLRGRVGRGSIRGNCLLLTPDTLTRDARKRLQVLVENTKLGAGFAVAAADLEIRGGGNLLGDAQSGNIDAVGYEIWVRLLEEAIDIARGQSARERLEPEIEVPIEAFIPESLVPDMNQRLSWYRKFSSAPTERGVEAVTEDFRVLVGELPKEVQQLSEHLKLRIVCRELGIARIAWHKVRVTLECHPGTKVTLADLEALVKAHPNRFAKRGGKEGEPLQLLSRFTPREAERPLRYLRWILARVAKRA